MTTLPLDRVYVPPDASPVLTDAELALIVAAACADDVANPLLKLVGRLAAEVRDLRAAVARAGGTVQRRRPSRTKATE